MTLVLPDAAIEFTEDLGQGYLGVFYSNSNGDLICSGSTYMNGQETAFPAMGDDATTDEIDGLVTNQEFLWIYTLDNGDQYYLTSFPHQGYTFNGIYYIEGFEYEPVNCSDVFGCLDEQANNYNSAANVDDGSCTYDVTGCTDEGANNYNSAANVDDGSCSYDGNNCGCTDPNYLEYYTQGYFANCSNNSCESPAQNAGLSSSSFNQPLNTSINLTLGLEINNLFIPNGTQVAAFYDLNQDGVINTNPLVTSSGQVYYECVGLTDYETSFFAMAIWGDDPLTEEVDGVPNDAENLLFALLTPDQSVVLFDIIPDQFTYSPNGLYAINEINLSPLISGCTNIDYCNYNMYATIDDGSCSGSYGCMEEMYVDYDPSASCHEANLCDESWYDVFVVSEAQNEELNSTITEMEIMMSDANATISSMTGMVDELTLMNEEMSSDLSASQAQNEELNSTITEMEIMMSDANATISSMTDMVDDMTLMIAEMNIRIGDLEYENDSLNNLLLASQNELALSNSTVDSLMVTIDVMALDYENMSSVNDSLSNPISIDLLSGWNIIGYTLQNAQDAVATFDGIVDVLSVVKNNAGEVYWPEFGFNGIGDLIPGQGYQVLMDDYYEGFVFENLNGLRVELSPTIPQWAIDMEVYTHPNDIKTLVRVVNNLGQEVNLDDEFKGAILYYLFNDGSVEKFVK